MTNADDIALSAVENALSKPPKGEGEIVSKSLLLIRQVDETIQLAIKAADDGCDLRAMRSFKTMMEQSRVCLSLAYENLSDAFNSRSPDTLTQERDALREIVTDALHYLSMRHPEDEPEFEAFRERAFALTQRGEG